MERASTHSILLGKIREVLDRPELRLGRSSVRVQEDAAAAELSPPLELWELRTYALEKGIVNLVALPGSAGEVNDQHVGFLKQKVDASRALSSAFLVCPLGAAAPALGSLSATKQVRLLSPNELFAKLISLPGERRFKDLVRKELNAKDTKNLGLYQDRSARILHDPGETGRADLLIESLDKYLLTWASSFSPRAPLLLLGERGTGKTWQLLKFCLNLREVHSKKKWEFGPGFAVQLRNLRGFAREAAPGIPLLPQYILEHYPGLSLYGDLSMLSAVSSAGHTIVCFDGFDEMDIQASDRRVQEGLVSIMNSMAPGSRFLMSARAGHFRSLENLLKQESWTGRRVGETFEVLELQRFAAREQTGYLQSLRAREGGERLADRIASLTFGENGEVVPGLRVALRSCAQHPALLALLRVKVEGTTAGAKRLDAVSLVRELIEEGLVIYNLEEERTLGDFYFDEANPRPQGFHKPHVELDVGERLAICEEIGWMLAARGKDSLDLAAMPDRVRLFFGLSGDSLERDIRSQTVFELVPAQEVSVHRKGSTEVDQGGVAAVERSSVRFTLRLPDAAEKVVTKTSVSGGFFVARYLWTRLRQDSSEHRLPLDAKMRLLGAVPLGEMAASILCGLLRETDTDVEALAREMLEGYAELARRGNFEIFASSYRFLAVNLQDMGLVDQSVAEAVNPWRLEVRQLGKAPERLAEYRLALIPGSEPFLLGVHEVTNGDYARFVASGQEGEEWSVERMTRAASRQDQPPSRFAHLSNEYHLYFWEKGRIEGKDMEFRPPTRLEDHPVTWVSWFACAAFCDWLSVGDSLPAGYRTLLEARPGESPIGFPGTKPSSGYRLPTASEWDSAAKAGHEELEFPWEMFPYYLSKEGALVSGAGREKPGGYYDRYQEVMRDVLVRASRDTRPVLYDEFNDYGISGLVGNVKEWCDDSVLLGQSIQETRGLIRGASGYLDEGSFRIGYGTELFWQNTNPDVGFRLARSLSSEELGDLRKYQEKVQEVLRSRR